MFNYAKNSYINVYMYIGWESSIRNCTPYMTVYFQLGYSFGMLASDTPTNDQNSVSFITPSPVVGEGHAPKAPMKKV